MTTEDSEKIYTVEEFLELDLPEDNLFELVEGQLLGRPKFDSGVRWSKVASKMNFFLQGYAGIGAGREQLGEVYLSAPCQLDNANYLVPDICFIAKDRVPDKEEKTL